MGRSWLLRLRCQTEEIQCKKLLQGGAEYPVDGYPSEFSKHLSMGTKQSVDAASTFCLT
jgi:hypothetical protein